jgi:hypothetical protein
VYQGAVRELLVKITSKGGGLSSAVYTLLEPPDPPAGNWPVLADNITIVETSGGLSVANNPHGLAQVGDFLYLIDYEAQKIYILGADELNGLAAGSPHTLVNKPFDVGAAAGLTSDAKGQAIIALNDGTTTYLYALYIDNNAAGTVYGPSILVRLTVDTDSTSPTYGELTYLDQVDVGLNAQEIIPVTETGGNITLLIPAIGGMQQAGTTNLDASVINSVEPFVAAGALSASVLLQGDNPTPTPATYDLRAIAAPSRPDSNGNVYVLTGTYDNDYNQDFRLYKSTVALLLSAGSTYLSDAVAHDLLTEVDYAKGMIGYFWDILYENAAGPDGDRLWFLRGAPILVSRAAAYGARSLYFGTGTAAGQIGGQVINSADLTAETVAQAKAGVSLKRGLRGTAPKIAEEEEK